MTPGAAGDAALRPLRRRHGFGVRLLLAQAMVLFAGVFTTAVIAAIVGPPLFREHLHRAGVPANSMEEVHAEEAYAYATVLSVGGALAVSALTALAVSWYISHRLQRSVNEVASAAASVAQGRYDIRVSPPELGDDFEALASAFNQMASRLQAVDANRRRLFSDLAHEIRTPVSVLEAYMEALEDGVRTLDPATTAMLRDQTRRLVRFSADLAALAQAEDSSHSMEPILVNVEGVVKKVVTASAERYAAKDVCLHMGSEGQALVMGDSQRLEQVIGNLLDNALRHTPSGGSVDVTTAVDSDSVEVSVVDTGEGITAEHIPHVFERFYRADAARDRDHGGAGIGLAIAKALVEAHGGSISARSDGPDQGCAFAVRLPKASPGKDSAAAMTTAGL
ncbi:HAMP domain-containing sensor histidine kinase [Mycolicibacterium sp. 120270]|uniref:sensor histidine kinase n=1 Tax=Mycolicibacterium sp. 120270 TaxID=3090600 RepID=UPI00299DC808|nr:HAMP domain-containing sensor histidine kinase [Mycolicibacterium sp. 120270]MDX1884457.1 HAMP domain-containing sensor histidine kinase [Mycolicibacterium sp. 120270]